MSFHFYCCKTFFEAAASITLLLKKWINKNAEIMGVASIKGFNLTT